MRWGFGLDDDDWVSEETRRKAKKSWDDRAAKIESERKAYYEKAEAERKRKMDKHLEAYGPLPDDDPLLAAMRCYPESNEGDRQFKSWIKENYG